MVNTAHVTEVTGKYSEIAARLALIANGWVVAEPETGEAFDLVARDPLDGEWKTFQVKTIRERQDRRNELVVYARKGDGTTYDRADADYIVGVWVVEGEMPRVYMFENRLLTEYWASKARASERWIELSLALNRSIYEEPAVEPVENAS
ncbi:hypothetical protein [Paenibacillus elgii]|uniref:hypothetical protein n=1 Tax=Paenibacillus elgii TaxID=189691 RepID=UPI000248DEEA|nr:hypothetical protein [Paenibacillus elgii]